jgi:hypothetical protein
MAKPYQIQIVSNLDYLSARLSLAATRKLRARASRERFAAYSARD